MLGRTTASARGVLGSVVMVVWFVKSTILSLLVLLFVRALLFRACRGAILKQF